MEPHANQLVSCPFNPAHQVEHYKFQTHITKCKKQYPDIPIVSCPFDNLHLVKRDELDHHVRHCPKRFLLDTQIHVTDEDHRPQVELMHFKQDFACSENWDDDNAQSYNSQEAKKNTVMYTKIKGATKSERKKFRYDSSIQYSRAMAQQQQPNAGPSTE